MSTVIALPEELELPAAPDLEIVPPRKNSAPPAAIQWTKFSGLLLAAASGLALRHPKWWFGLPWMRARLWQWPAR